MTRRRVLAMVDHGVDRHLLKRLVKVRRGWRKASETGRCGSVDLTLPLAPRIGAAPSSTAAGAAGWGAALLSYVDRAG